MNKQFIIGKYLISLTEETVLVKTSDSEGNYPIIFEVNDIKYRLKDDVNDIVLLHNKKDNTMTVCLVYSNVVEMIEWSFANDSFKIDYASYKKPIVKASVEGAEEEGEKLIIFGDHIVKEKEIEPVSTMSEFIDILSEIEKDDSIKEDKYLTNGVYDDLPDLLKTAIVTAEHFLISEGGGCEWGRIQHLKDSGYNVFAGEKDSFGWLTGCISTSKGIIVYG